MKKQSSLEFNGVSASLREAEKASRFPTDDFHDARILGIDFSDWQQKVRLSLYCPFASKAGAEVKTLCFKRVLMFSMEMAALGELGNNHVMVHYIGVEVNSSIAQIWRGRIALLAEATKNYPDGMKSRKYTDVYHFVFDSTEFASLVSVSSDTGFDIVCRDFEIE